MHEEMNKLSSAFPRIAVFECLHLRGVFSAFRVVSMRVSYASFIYICTRRAMNRVKTGRSSPVNIELYVAYVNSRYLNVIAYALEQCPVNEWI